ncbi:hypothetical protein NVP1084O_054 [Vibrio phage 1.084.O._10N.261.49.F5]|nr:hypothetical protein NVP1084O_054 [Vibrio phage 1.084.O._10N.261.49.F5]
MCWCNPNLRTPCCGNIDCIPPRALSYEEKQLDNLLEQVLYYTNKKFEGKYYKLNEAINNFRKENK